jgi:phosphohistidine phosphatase
VLVVGHNPGLEELVEQLTGEHHDLPTAALVHITLAIDDWSEVSAGTGSIVDAWRPRESL